MIEEPARRTSHATAVVGLAGPFDLALSLKGAASFLPAQDVTSTTLRAGMYVDGGPAIIEIRQRARQIEAIGPAHLTARRLREIAAWLVGVDLDLQPFYQLAAAHPMMRSVTHSLCGLKPLRPASLFEMVVIAITEQQLSLAVV